MTAKENKTTIDLTQSEIDYILMLTSVEVDRYKRLKGETDYYFHTRHQVRMKLVEAMKKLREKT